MANEFLTKRVAKATLDFTAAYTASVTNAGGEFTGTATDMSEAADTLNIENHIFQTGDKVACITNTGGTIPTAPAADTDYFIIRVDDDTVQLATSLANAMAGTETPITVGAGAGLQYLIKDVFGTITFDMSIPSGAIITATYYNNRTAITSDDVIAGGSDGLGITMGTGAAANDIDTAVILTATPNHGLVGIPILGADNAHDTAAKIAVLVAASFVETAAVLVPYVVITTEAAVGGIIDLYVEYAV